MLKFRLESAQWESGSDTRLTATATTGTRDTGTIIRAAITGTTGAIRITKLITTTAGRTTAIDITGITIGITASRT